MKLQVITPLINEFIGKLDMELLKLETPQQTQPQQPAQATQNMPTQPAQNAQTTPAPAPMPVNPVQ
jgi:hypothetical protein